jgi:flagellar basal-body rod protein FlgB
MFTKLTNALDFQAKALVIRADRQRIIASNIANADTPGYAGRDINFKDAMENALAGDPKGILPAPSDATLPDGRSHARHIAIGQLQSATLGPKMDYTLQTQPAMDGNSVDLDRERANFVDNSVRYEATLRFINGTSRTILSAIQGQ